MSPPRSPKVRRTYPPGRRGMREPRRHGGLLAGYVASMSTWPRAVDTVVLDLPCRARGRGSGRGVRRPRAAAGPVIATRRPPSCSCYRLDELVSPAHEHERRLGGYRTSMSHMGDQGRPVEVEGVPEGEHIDEGDAA